MEIKPAIDSASQRLEFQTTQWSDVLAVRGGDSEQVRTSLEKLCRAYWYPIYAFVRREGHTPQDAQDLTQAFRAAPETA